jgi:predicted Ser/Thr protein kinase
MKSYQELAESVRYRKKGSRFEAVSWDRTLSHIGTGRSACAFRINGTDRVIKVYYPVYHYIAEEEAEIYSKLREIPSFPALYDAGINYIVIDYIEGRTFFQCLTGGEQITESFIAEVDKALLEVSRRELNPSDIHLHNLILTPDGKVKIIDPARFNQEKNCTQWDDLKTAYSRLYKKKLCPKKIPALLLLSISTLYKHKVIKV